MKATVVFSNASKGFFAVITEDHDYTVIEITDSCDVDVGDVISGKLDSEGDNILKNLTKNESMSTYIQAVHSSERNARALVYP